MLPRYALLIVATLGLAACNLGQAGPTPTMDPNILETWTPLPVTPIVQPTEASPIPSGRALPTPLPMTNTPDGVPPRPVTPVLLTPLPLGVQNANPAALPARSAVGAASRYPITLRPGETVGINYAVTVLAGTVTLVFQGPEGILWQKTFTASEADRAEVTVQTGGNYEVLAFTDRFNGSYDLSWD
ncbi:MAG: hypothetical protein HZC41_09110 [Chloroflexi bacterium]|nr:hypothetical protein [Chloroflexota bacterium]